MCPEFNDPRDDLVIEDGRAHCPVDDCDVWYPLGMEYGYLEHYPTHDG